MFNVYYVFGINWLRQLTYLHWIVSVNGGITEYSNDADFNVILVMAEEFVLLVLCILGSSRCIVSFGCSFKSVGM